MPDLPQMLTVQEVAAMLRVSERYVRQELIGKGRVQAIKLSLGKCGRWRIYEDSVAALVGRLPVKGPSDEVLRLQGEAICRRLGW